MQLTGFAFWDVHEGPLSAGYTPLADVTALIGPNDSGKSSTLGLLASALDQPQSARAEDVLETPPLPGLVVYVSCSPGERDLFLSVIADPMHDPYDGPQATQSTEDPDEILELALGPRAEPRGGVVQLELDLEERFGDDVAESLLGALDATRTFAFQLTSRSEGEHRGPTWLVHWCLEADHSLAPLADDDATDFGRPRFAAEPVALWTLGPTELRLLPRPVLAPRGLTPALKRLEAVVGVLATWIRMGDVTDPVYDDAFAAGYDDQDSWVIGADQGLTVRVDPLVSALTRAAEAAANDRLPPFVREHYELSVNVRPILVWDQRGRLGVSLTRHGETEPFDAERAAAGLRTWIEIAVLEAAAMLEGFAGVAEFLGAGDHDWNYERASPEFARPPEVDEFSALMRSDALIEDPLLLVRERRQPRRFAEWIFGDLRRHHADIGLFLSRLLGRPFYLLDEPERHMHIGLQQAAARWLEDTFRSEEGQALIATHAPSFLNGSPELQVVRVDRSDPAGGLLAIDAHALRATDDLSHEMGFDRGVLLAGLAAIIHVEGSFDRYVLKILLEEELRHARIAVRAFGGTHNITEILADPLLQYTTAKIAVVVDNVSDRELQKLKTSPEHRAARAESGRNEAKWLARLLQGAEHRRRQLEPFSIGERDMFFLLDDFALRHVSRKWPGHDEARARWQHERATAAYEGWKAFYADRFGVAVNNTTARKAAEHMHNRGEVPDVLRSIVESVERLALTRR